MTVRPHPPRLLTIAGSDSGGGAGIQADLKTFAAHGAYGMSAVTAVTAQNTRRVSAVEALSPALVAAQIDAVFEDLGVDGVKIGMLANAAIVETVAERLARWSDERAIPIVLDPVMVAKSGDPLLADDAVAALAELLVPLATVVTPNLPEASRLTGVALATGTGEDDLERRREAGRRLAARGPAVLLKGGHGDGEEVVDLLLPGSAPGAASALREERLFRHPRQATRATHGTGCTLSSALVARLAAGEPLAEAAAGAIAYLQGAMRAAYALGGGHGPVDHLYCLRSRPPESSP